MARVTKSSVRCIVTVVLGICLLAGTAQAAGNPGDAGLIFLRLGIGARETGMGDAGVASSHGAAAIFWNPANNVFADFETELILQHRRWLGLLDHEGAALAHRLGNGGVLGFIFSGIYSDEQTRYSADGVGVPMGQFSPYDMTFGISYAHPLGDRFSFGVTAKVVYERIDVHSGTGFAVDLGVTHKALVDGLLFAATATNLGGQMNLDDGPYDLPAAFRLGASWTPTGALKERLTLAGDIFLPNDTDEKAHLGGEFRLIKEFALRLGYKFNYDIQGLTAGAGFRIKHLSVDYAYQDIVEDGFDSGHLFSLGLTW